MQRLLWLSTVLVSGFSVLLVVVRHIGNTAPPPEITRFWHLDDCALPCWAGIVLQQTTRDEAEQHLVKLFNPYTPEVTQSFNSGFLIVLHDADGNNLGNVQVLSDRKLVSRITLKLRYPKLRQFMEVVQQYGLPTCAFIGVFTGANDYTVMFDRPAEGAHIFVSQNLRLTPILTLIIETPLFSSCRDLYPAWHGFTYR